MDLLHIALTGLIAFGALGLVAGVALAMAAIRCKVDVNPKVETVKHVLPGANCGACAFPGCEAYADAVVNDPDVAPDLCRPGGLDVSSKVARLTAKTMGGNEPVVSFRRCIKDEGKVKAKCDYNGVPSCAAANLALGGPDACSFSCIGFGDCARACPFDAMYLESGLVRINAELCTGCGVCIRVCPKQVLELTPRNARVMEFCNSRDKGKAVMDVCAVGCIACNKCVKVCPAKAVSMQNGRIHVDHKACVAYGPSCNEICVEDCPRKILRRLGETKEKSVEKEEKKEGKEEAA